MHIVQALVSLNIGGSELVATELSEYLVGKGNTAGSSILAIILTSPSQSLQVSISMLNTRFNRFAQWSGCPGVA
jgi:hypothetical protein